MFIAGHDFHTDGTPALPDDIGALGQDAAMDLVAALDLPWTIGDNGVAATVRAAHVYPRKGNLSFDTLGGPRNASYGPDKDPVVVQLSYVLGYRGAEGEAVRRVAESIRTAEVERKRAELDAQIAAQEAELERLRVERSGL